ncbi:nuclear envelope integral membrane protein 1 [Paramormyrops kingsleyae]|uniref:Nuclear envelope integral membrane protein 1 n=1 Tax=Paramormyrops kingsleyae TaxID=1676925 RepID=A0A3B3RVJ3_9TELE|nr:nuclear envelope integral membrane protein 1-like [Paramormyrops kingsleyae]
MAGYMKCRLEFYSSCGSITAVLLCFIFYFITIIDHTSALTGNKLLIKNISDGEELKELKNQQYFCYQNYKVPGWRETWTRIQIRVCSSKQFKLMVVQDEEELQELEYLSIWNLMQLLLRERSNETTIDISLFRAKTCFRVDPVDHENLYTVKVMRRFDIYLFSVFLAGLLLFIFADMLSRSQVFYYSAGMTTGMVASLIILIFIMARLLPKRSPFYVLIVGGWSFSVYLIQLVFRNLQLILKEHWHLALGYTAVVGFVSFAVCYRYGPLVEQRSINILSWVLQLFGLLLVYAGIQVQQVALAIIIAAFCSKHLEHPVRLGFIVYSKLKPSWPRKLEPRRLLTEEEYQKQAEVETQYALAELREFCSSPEFNTWKTVSRLQSPKRFADFIEGSPHLMPNEVSIHAQEYGLGGSFFEEELFATDEDEEDEDEEHDQMRKIEGMQKDYLRNHRGV